MVAYAQLSGKRYDEPAWFIVSSWRPGYMAVVRFDTDDIWRCCSDAAQMRKRWGPDGARAVSRRLQQLQAMRTLSDLRFMPFDSHRLDNGIVEVVINHQLALLVEEASETLQGGT